MSVYTQRISNIVDQLPESEQQFIFEFVKKISVNYSVGAKEMSSKSSKTPNQKDAVKKFIETLNSVEPLADDEFDDILNKGISLRTPEELDEL